MSSTKPLKQGKCILDFDKVDQFESMVKTLIEPGIAHYKMLRVIERFVDEEGLLAEETVIVEHNASAVHFTMRLIELKDPQTILAVLRETDVLKKVGFHKNVMGLFAEFRHRQYAGFLFPAYSSLRDRLDVRHRSKTEPPNKVSARFHEDRALRWDTALAPKRESDWRQLPGLFDRDAVVLVLRKVIKGLDFVHSKGFVHTQVSATNCYMDDHCRVKLGGFLHCRREGSKRWEFTGNPNRHPPEAFLANENERLTVGTSFDIWSLGLLTLELITGVRSRHSGKTMQKVAMEYLDGVREPPNLEEFEPESVVNGEQRYDEDVEDFVQLLLQVNPRDRAILSEAAQHSFLRRDIDREQARRDWKLSISTGSQWDGSRSLYAEAFSSQGSSVSLDPPFLKRVLRAVGLAEKNFYPIFKKPTESKLSQKCIGVEASLAIEHTDMDWSRDVLDISATNSAEFLQEHDREVARVSTPNKRSSDALGGDKIKAARHVPGKNDKKSYQRTELVFFVKKSWSEEERQLFVALQFARWYERQLIEFADVLRMADEIEDVFRRYILATERVAKVKDVLPDSVYFASVLRRVLFEAAEHVDKDTRRFNHIYVDVALQPSTNLEKKEKYEKLAYDDPVETPDGLSLLQASATYHEIDPKRLEVVEKILFGEERVENWDVDEDQREVDSMHRYTLLTHLLFERRRNPNNLVTSDNDPTTSNQARMAKLWGGYDRDYLFRACKWVIPYQMENADANLLFGDGKREDQLLNSELSDLDIELLRTRAKQENDYLHPVKVHDAVDARRAAISLSQGTQKSATKKKMLQQARGLDADVEVPSPAPLPSKKLTRFPKSR